MDKRDKLIKKLEELIAYYDLEYCPLASTSNVFILINKGKNKLKREIAALKAEVESKIDINQPFFGNSGVKTVLDYPSDFDTIATNRVSPRSEITDADIEAWAMESSFTKNSFRYKALIAGAKAVINNEIKHK